jgi:hypothetical protein
VALAFISGFLFETFNNSIGTSKQKQKKTAGHPAVFKILLRIFSLREDLSTAGGA